MGLFVHPLIFLAFLCFMTVRPVQLAFVYKSLWLSCTSVAHLWGSEEHGEWPHILIIVAVIIDNTWPIPDPLQTLTYLAGMNCSADSGCGSILSQAKHSWISARSHHYPLSLSAFPSPNVLRYHSKQHLFLFFPRPALPVIVGTRWKCLSDEIGIFFFNPQKKKRKLPT